MMTLDDLAGRWLAPRCEEGFSLPAITNFHGTVQADWGIAGIRNWICPPTGMATPTPVLFSRDGERPRPVPPRSTAYRWKAYEIERHGAGVSSVVRMPAHQPGVMAKLRFERGGTYYLVFGGLPRVWRFTDYWNLPPEDVPMFNVRLIEGGFLLDDTKTFGRARFSVPGRCAVYGDLLSWLDGDRPRSRGRIGVAELSVQPGEEIQWTGIQGCEERLPELDGTAQWDTGRSHWEQIWEAAFQPQNGHFSGSLPELPGELERLYCMGVLTLLQCRRHLPRPTRRSRIATGGQCIWNSDDLQPIEKAYIWGGPEGGMTTLFLWELEFQAPLLARLDPAVLRAQMEAMIRVDLHRHWGFETVSGRGAGMGYGVNPGGFLSCVADYVRITGDRGWALEREEYLRSCCRPGLTDYGVYENILECVATYEHQIAAFNALNVKGMRFVAELFGDVELAAQADRLAAAVLELYAGGPFACLQPDGTRRVARTILDFVYVGRCMTGDLPAAVKRGMVDYFAAELQTEDWLHALAPHDADASTPLLPSFQSYRADHQASGSYDGWPARAASVLLRFGERERALEWLRRIQELTYEGPFGQAHFIHPDGRARKASFYNGNCYVNAAGSTFATTILEDAGC